MHKLNGHLKADTSQLSLAHDVRVKWDCLLIYSRPPANACI